LKDALPKPRDLWDTGGLSTILEGQQQVLEKMPGKKGDCGV